MHEEKLEELTNDILEMKKDIAALTQLVGEQTRVLLLFQSDIMDLKGQTRQQTAAILPHRDEIVARMEETGFDWETCKEELIREKLNEETKSL